MSEPEIHLEHEGVAYSAEIMTVKSTSLGAEDHGIFTASLHLEGDGTGVSLGGYGLDGKPDKDAPYDAPMRRPSTAYGMDFVRQLLWVCGAERWEKLSGVKVLTLWPGDSRSHWGLTVLGIADLTGKRVFIPKAHAALWFPAEAGVKTGEAQ